MQTKFSEVCILCTISVVISSLCFGLLWDTRNLKLLSLFVLQYLFVACTSLYGTVYLKMASAGTLHANTTLRNCNLWIFGCFIIMSIQMIIVSVGQL
jgi:hypothetical protein